MCVCVCVCVRERERERERGGGGSKDIWEANDEKDLKKKMKDDVS